MKVRRRSVSGRVASGVVGGLLCIVGPVALMLSTTSPAQASSAALVNRTLAQINQIRQTFKLAPATLTHAYDAAVVAGAVHGGDPILPKVVTGVAAEYGEWGEASAIPPETPDPVTVIQTWVYHDGWLGANTLNVDCTAKGAPGCNVHRRAILSAPPRAGAKLFIDIAVQSTTLQGQPATSLAAILVWKIAS